MGRNDAAEDATADTSRARVAALVGTSRTVLVVGTAPDALAEELRGRGCDVAVLDRRPTSEPDDVAASPDGPEGWGRELGERTFDVVVLAEATSSGPDDVASVLGGAAARLRAGGTVVVPTPQGPVRLVLAGDGAASAGGHDGENDEVTELRQRLLTLRDHVIGLEATTATARAQAARAQREAQQQLEEMAASVTWRAGRLAVKPASWVRTRLVGRR